MTRHEQAARMLLEARSRGVTIEALPDALKPEHEDDAYAVQRLVMAGLGAVGGWKVGAPGPDGPITCAPMPKHFIVAAPASLSAAEFRQREVESEIAFLIGRDLPSSGVPYGEAEVRGAIASCHPGIEVLQSAFADPNGVGALSVLADLIQHGAYAVGDAIPGWETIEFDSLEVIQSVEAGPAKHRIGNPAGDMMRLLLFLANEGSAWAGGLKAGQLVTCGSWTGKTRVSAAGVVTAAFGAHAPVVLHFVDPVREKDPNGFIPGGVDAHP